MRSPIKHRANRRTRGSERSRILQRKRLAVEPLEPRRLLAAAGAIAGVAWLDADGDGQRGADEPGVPGWTMFLDTNGNGQFDPTIEPATITRSGGRYAFEGLPAGDYTVGEILLPGWEQTSPDEGMHKVRLAAGQVVDSVHFGNRPTEIEFGGITGLKWHDRNGDGERQNDEPGLPGVRIYLDVNGNEQFDSLLEPVTSTGRDGSYAFRALPPGEYVVAELQQVGWEQTFPEDLVHEVTVEAGQIVDGVDFGNRPSEVERGSVHGFKWSDLNGNRRRDPDEPGLAGVTIYSDLNGNGQLDDEEPHAVSMPDDPVTDVDEAGMYWLDNLRPGNHVIREVVPDGFRQTFPGPILLPPNLPQNAVDDEPRDEFFTVHPEQIRVALAAGESFSTTVSITIHPLCVRPYNIDVVASDPDVSLKNFTGVVLNGCGGDRSVFDVAMVGDGWPHSFALQFVDAEFGGVLGKIPVHIAGTGTVSRGHLVNLKPGDVLTDIDFGNRPIEVKPGSIHGVKWNDLNGNGQRDADELGLAGVTIYSDLNHNGRFDDGEPNAVTMEEIPETDFDEGGLYSLDGLQPGRHVIREVVPDGSEQTFPREGGGHSISLPSGHVAGGIDFGNRPIEVETASIRGFKFNDRNSNGRRDADEEGLAGFTIYLDRNNNGELDEHEPRTRTTGGDPRAGGPVFEPGHYSFAGLEPGEYVVREVQQDGFEQTFPSDGGAHKVVLQSGDAVRGVDFGNHRSFEPASIHGVKFLDENGNGERDRDEPGLAGVTIYLDLNDDGVFNRGELATTTLGIGPLPLGLDLPGVPELPELLVGRYWFSNLTPGKYVVREVLQDGWQQTFPREEAHRLELASGEEATGVDFGNRREEPSDNIIAGTKWWDRNGNAQRDHNDIGLGGFTIYLDSNDNGELDPGEPRTVTSEDNPNTRFDESGRYAFENLADGEYVVREAERRGWKQSFPREDAPHEVKIEGGRAAAGAFDVDFGNRRMGGPLADLTRDGFVDFDDLAVLLANWNGRMDASAGNIYDSEKSPIDFDDLAVLLAEWTGPAPAASPQAAVRSNRLQPVEENRVNPVTTSEPAGDAYFDRLGRRDRRQRRDDTRLRRLQSVAVDRAIESTAETSQRRFRPSRRRHTDP